VKAKSVYDKFYRSKRQYPTHAIRGSGNAKGGLIIGSVAALRAITDKYGPLDVVRTMHTRSQWVFCVKRGTKQRLLREVKRGQEAQKQA